MLMHINYFTKIQIMIVMILSGAIEANACEAGSVASNSPSPPSAAISNMLRVKVDDKRVLNDPFNYITVFEVKKTEVLEFPQQEDANFDKGYGRKALSFRICYDPQQKVGPTEEIVTFGDEAMFDQLLCDLHNRVPEDVANERSPQKKRRLSYDFSNIDYYEAVIGTVERLTENEGQIPAPLINLLIESGIDKEKFVAGFSDSIKHTEKELKRKREEEEESDTEISYKFGNYISYLAGLGDFSSRCEVLVNGDEGVFTMELTLQTLDERVDASPLPKSVLAFHKKLKNWAIGKVFTLFNKKFQLMRKKGETHSGMFN
ncbi:hypothetical protein [Candidatus Odyssella acanthamoebae]|uniref:Uncharacterized protein n=1 Tax=Candidatus Odyssella acanthamoebae TaxID=91604 RepID=A0A077AUI7_9PROT|nr:hypothetical protein [Candidatus Paracaedibacter acanthamoebae]AIK96051.1 hypothetical protein ID47_03770 [Candidatus Paracaedibacter acanthamoebae]